VDKGAAFYFINVTCPRFCLKMARSIERPNKDPVNNPPNSQASVAARATELAGAGSPLLREHRVRQIAVVRTPVTPG